MPLSIVSPPRGLRLVRARILLFVVPGLFFLVYVFGPLHSRQHASQSRIPAWIKQTKNKPDLEKLWTDERQQRLDCLTQWFQTGTVCNNPPRRWSKQDKLDVIWRWNNASLDRDQHDQAYTGSLDLLRYSFRSAQQHMQNGFGTITLLTPDVPGESGRQVLTPESRKLCTHVYHDHMDAIRYGQRPCWLALKDPIYDPPTLVHHRQVACAGNTDLTRELCTAPAIIAASTPESTSYLLATRMTQRSDVRLIVSPHHMFAAHVSSSDFWSPLYGLVFRISADPSDLGHIPPTITDTTDPADAPAIRANALLDRRFGERPRRRLIDVAQPLSTSIMDEIFHIWPRHLTFASSTSPNTSIDLAFLHAYYVAERHREALLWSFLVAKHDRDGDGIYSPEEVKALLQDLGADDVNAEKPVMGPVYTPIRLSNNRANVRRNLKLAGLPHPLTLKPIHTAMDASAWLTPETPEGAEAWAEENPGKQPPPICVLEYPCYESLYWDAPKPSVRVLFQRMTQEMPSCGLCVLYHLTTKSGTQGLSAFLPPPDLTMSPMDKLPVMGTWQGSDFSLTSHPGGPQVKRLDVVINLLERYNHGNVLEEPMLAPAMPDRIAASDSLVRLEFVNESALFSFKQHGPIKPELTPEQAMEFAVSLGFEHVLTPDKPSDWARYARAWLSIRHPYKMRFETDYTAL